MISRYEVSLNDVPLGNISPYILILDVRYTPPAISNETYTVAKRHGARIHRRYVDKSTVTIDFVIRAYDIRHRQEICNRIVKWAKNGGVLWVNDRPGQRLRCVCDSFPVIMSALKWTDKLSIAFSAYALPFWEEVLPASLKLTGTSAKGSLYVPGDVDGAMIEATVKADASLSNITLAANNRLLTLSRLSVAAGQTITVTYDDEMIQSIKVGSTSLLDKRTGADDLLANCGENNALSVSANAPVTVTFKVRGLWL